MSNNSVAFTELDEPVVPLTHMVTENYFDVLGVEPHLGRTFEAGDATGNGVVVVSHGIWQRVLGGDPTLIGKTVVLDDEPFVVIGILRSDFYSTHQLPVQPDLWLPTAFVGREQDRTARNNAVFARLRPGVTVAQAQQEISAIAAEAEAEFPESNNGWGVRVTPVRDNVVGVYRRTFSFLLMAVGLVLLIACANVANLGLAHAIERSREVALRSALGAGRARLLRQMISEGLVLAALGGATGVLLTFAALPVLLRLIPGTGAGGGGVDDHRRARRDAVPRARSSRRHRAAVRCRVVRCGGDPRSAGAGACRRASNAIFSTPGGSPGELRRSPHGKIVRPAGDH